MRPILPSGPEPVGSGPRPTQVIAARVGLVVAVLALESACGPGSSPAVPTGGLPATYVVTGHLKGVGGPTGHGATPWARTVTWTGSRHGSAQTDSRGRFTLELRRGTYQLTGHSPSFGDGAYLCSVGHPVSLSGTTTRLHVDVLCQMK
jgi:hypothetical protein